VSTGANAGAARRPDGDYISSSQTTTSATYTDLATAGPVITVTTGTRAIVWISAKLTHGTALGNAFMAYDVSGATTIAADDAVAVAHAPGVANGYQQAGIIILQGSLTSGSNTFTAKYRTNTGTATFTYRRLVVFPL